MRPLHANRGMPARRMAANGNPLLELEFACIRQRIFDGAETDFQAMTKTEHFETKLLAS